MIEEKKKKLSSHYKNKREENNSFLFNQNTIPSITCATYSVRYIDQLGLSIHISRANISILEVYHFYYNSTAV